MRRAAFSAFALAMILGQRSRAFCWQVLRLEKVLGIMGVFRLGSVRCLLCRPSLVSAGEGLSFAIRAPLRTLPQGPASRSR